VLYIHIGVLFGHEEKCNYVICRMTIDETGDNHSK
jgi:hypothetical protein